MPHPDVGDDSVGAAALKAETATRLVGAGEISEVPVAAIRPGDIVLLRPGERCAVDGTVIEGRSEIDQSLITGETQYATAEHGTAVYAGSLNISGLLRIRVSAASAFRQVGACYVFAVRQRVRPDAQGVVSALQARGIAVEILSGDREPAVLAAASALGISRWRAGVTPADKIARIEGLKRQGFKVMMVGDGLNDAPALAAAHVSMSPISAAHLSQATADLVFLGKPLAPVVAAIDFSRKALLLMRQNLRLAVGYNLLAVPIAISGVVTPLIAAAAMSGSSMLVMLNALRARRVAHRRS
jgi:cation transport ATPase